MRLNPETIDPKQLRRPASVAAQLGVHQSMVTHWTQDGVLDYVDIDGAKFIPDSVVEALQNLRQMKQDRRSTNRNGEK